METTALRVGDLVVYTERRSNGKRFIVDIDDVGLITEMIVEENVRQYRVVFEEEVDYYLPDQLFKVCKARTRK